MNVYTIGHMSTLYSHLFGLHREDIIPEIK